MNNAVKRNREPIFNILKDYLKPGGKVIEIGGGTGEHAIYFCSKLKKIHWLVTDVKENLKIIKENIEQSELTSIKGPMRLKIGEDDFPKGQFDYVYSSNTLHIMSWKESKSFFKLLGKRLRKGSMVFFYGPFNYDNEFTSESNKDFDHWLKSRNEKSGIRNFQDVCFSMDKNGFDLTKDHEMPANNRLLVFERREFEKGKKSERV